jgi:hypothetical protein
VEPVDRIPAYAHHEVGVPAPVGPKYKYETRRSDAGLFDHPCSQMDCAIGTLVFAVYCWGYVWITEADIVTDEPVAAVIGGPTGPCAPWNP